MDEALSVEERATLRAGAIRVLREMKAEQEARLPPRPFPCGHILRTTPAERDQFNRSLDQLRRAGERIYTADYDWLPVIPPRKTGKRQDESVSTDQFVATIKRVLARVDRDAR